MKHFDTVLESAGAEHLVIGQLLIDRILAFSAHANQAGYDLLAVDPSTHKTLRIQVKSRVGTDSGPWPVQSFDFDFAVLVRLNRGTMASLKAGSPEQTEPPQFYVVPASFVAELRGAKEKVKIAHAQVKRYLNAWPAIGKALAQTAI